MKNEIKGNLVIIMKKVLPILSLCYMVVVCLLTRVIVLIKLPLILQIFLLFIGYGMLLEFMMNRQEMDAQYRKGYLILYGLLLVCALVLSIIYLRSTIGLYVLISCFLKPGHYNNCLFDFFYHEITSTAAGYQS